jgi:hypothetical protein
MDFDIVVLNFSVAATGVISLSESSVARRFRRHTDTCRRDTVFLYATMVDFGLAVKSIHVIVIGHSGTL